MKNKKGSIAWLARCVICMGVLVGIMFGTSACTGGESEKKTQEETEQNETVKSPESISHRYSNANDRMVYFPLEDTVDDMLMAGSMKQWSLDGTEGDCVILPVKEYGSEESNFDLIWVGNEEIVWSTEDEGENQKVLSTPIRRTEKGETVVPEQTKELFTIEMRRDPISGASGYESGTVYVDEERIVFVSYGSLYVYDRKAGGEPVKVGEAFGEKDTYVYMPDKMYSLTAEVAGDSLFCHTGRTPGKVGEASYEFWDYHMGDGTAKRIDDRCFSDAAYVADSARGAAYYQVIDGRGIWQYDSRTGEKSELISEEMFRTCYEENQLFWEEDACYNDSLFVEGDSLYFIKNLENPQVLSYSLSEGSLSYKKELTEAVQRSGYVDEKSDRSQRLFVIKDKLLLYWDDYDEDEEYYICIDIPTAQMKSLGDSDSEKIYFGMVGAWEEPGTSDEWKEREKTQESSPEQSQTSLSVEEQLALISRCKDVWLDTSDDGGGPLMQKYAVTDLDHNGRLEVIASSGRQGSGAFTSSEYYQVSEDGTGLRHIRSSEETDAVDIVDGIETAYVEQKTGTYYYCTQDYMSGGAGNRYMWYGAIVLKSGMLTARTYASVEENKKGWHFKYYKDGKGKKVSKAKFNADSQAEKMFAGCEKKKVSISWFDPGRKKEQTEDKLEKKLKKSYEGFSVK